MKYFTPEDCKPSELSLQIIRTIAHCYPSYTMSEEEKKLCWS